MDSNGDRFRFFHLALRCSAFLFILWLAGMSLPALAASPITGVIVSPATATVSSGGAVYLRATVQGTGDFDHRVNWSLSPGNAGNVSPTGLFISDPGFTGPATVTATSVESSTFSNAATITVGTGGGVAHVDLNNGGIEDGTALHPYRTIQGAINHAAVNDTIKVAQGIYTESVTLPWEFGVLLLGGFKGGSAVNYAAALPGDFVTRSTDHVTQVTTIQSPDRSTLPAVYLGTWDPQNLLTYAVDGFTLTGGANGIYLNCRGLIDFFISQNLIVDNGTVTVGTGASGGGILADGANLLALNNRIMDNKARWGGGLFFTGANSFLIQGNVIDNNHGGDDFGGGVILDGTGSFTWNLVRGNRANLLSTYGYGGGLYINGGPVGLSHNAYGNNEARSEGGGILVAQGATAVLRHELIFKNQTTEVTGGAGIYVMPGAWVTVDHCTITGNYSAGLGGNGLAMRETATVQVSNSIIWGNSGDQLLINPGATFSMTYSDSQPYLGIGNLSVDPRFANPATDNYHLKSKRGRWDPALAQWVTDAVHSPCIDKGDPAAAFDQEPVPNRSRTNMGVYGNTPEASKSQAALEGMFQLMLLGD